MVGPDQSTSCLSTAGTVFPAKNAGNTVPTGLAALRSCPTVCSRPGRSEWGRWL